MVWRLLVAGSIVSAVWLGGNTYQNIKPNQDVKAAVVAQSTQTQAFTASGVGPDPNQLLAEVNATRTTEGKSPLIADKRVEAIAQARANDMATRHYYAHKNPDGIFYYNLLDQQSIPTGYSCENLNLTPEIAPAASVNDWMASDKGHRKCLLDARVSNAGYAVAQIESGAFKGITTPEYIIVAIHTQPQ